MRMAARQELAAPAASWTDRAWQAALAPALAALGFFLPFSTAGTSLAMGVLLALALLRPLQCARLAPWREPAAAIGLLLLAYIALRTLLGEPWSAEAGAILNRYHELLMVPILWCLLRLARHPQWFVRGLFTGALMFAALHWLALPLAHAELDTWLLTRRISAGFGLAVCAFFLFEHGRLRALPRGPAYAAALFLAGTVIFAIGGRTGHLVLFLLLGCAAWRAAPQRWRGTSVLGVLLAGVLVASLSSTVQERVAETVHALQADGRGRMHDSATGIRIELLRGGLAVAGEHWLAGAGWHGYSDAFRAETGVRHQGMPAAGSTSDNPHNEYLLQLGAGGAPALLLFLAWLAWPMRMAWREGRTQPWTGALGCIALAFATGCLFNSLLLDFVEGHLYGALMAWLLARRERA